jgi:hypothetical protein
MTAWNVLIPLSSISVHWDKRPELASKEQGPGHLNILPMGPFIQTFPHLSRASWGLC